MEPNESMNRSRHEPPRNRTGTNRFAVHEVIFEPMRIDANHGNPAYIQSIWFSSSSVRLCQQIRQSRPSEKWQGCLSSWRVGSLLEVPCTRVCSWFRSPCTGCQFTGCHQPTKLTSAAALMRPLRAPKCGHPSDRSLFSLGGNSLQRWTTWNLEWKFHTSVCVHASQSIISIFIFYYLCSLYIYTVHI